jgi:hypothetical protein
MRSLEQEFGDVLLMQVVWLGRDMGVLLRQPPRYDAFRLLLTGVTRWHIRGEEPYSSPPLGWEGFLKRTDDGWLLQITFTGLELEIESQDADVCEAPWDESSAIPATSFLNLTTTERLRSLTVPNAEALQGRLQGIAWGLGGDLCLVLTENSGSEVVMSFDAVYTIRLNMDANAGEVVRWAAESSEATDSGTTTVLRPVGAESEREVLVAAGKMTCWRIHRDNTSP